LGGKGKEIFLKKRGGGNFPSFFGYFKDPRKAWKNVLDWLTAIGAPQRGIGAFASKGKGAAGGVSNSDVKEYGVVGL